MTLPIISLEEVRKPAPPSCQSRVGVGQGRVLGWGGRLSAFKRKGLKSWRRQVDLDHLRAAAPRVLFKNHTECGAAYKPGSGHLGRLRL